MKRFLILLMTLAACEGEGPIVVASEGWFEPASLDFGSRAVDERHELPAVFVNNLVREILVSDVRFDPALEAVYSVRTDDGDTLRGTPVRPAERVGIKVIYVPKSEQRYDTNMQVFFEDSVVSMPISGSGRVLIPPTLEIVPSRIDFFETELGRDVIRTIEIRNTGDLPADVTRVKMSTGRTMSSTDEFQLKQRMTGALASSFSLAPTESTSFDVHFHPSPPVGQRNEVLELVIDGADPVEIPLAGAAVTSGTLECTPSPLNLGSVLRGEFNEERLECVSRGGVFTLASIGFASGSSDLFSLPLPPSVGVSLRDGETMRFSVRLSGSGRAVAHSGMLEIVAAHGAELSIPVTGSVVAPVVTDTGLSVQIQWNTEDTDLDLHLARAGANPFDPLDDCYYGRAHQDWGVRGDPTDDPYLDVDDRDGRGPEQINLAEVSDGQYDIYVHYFGGLASPVTQVVASVYERGIQKYTGETDLAVCGALWHAARVQVAGGIVVNATAVGGISDARGRARCP